MFFGFEFVKILVSKGFDVFFDFKFYDILNMVVKVCKVVVELGVWMVNVYVFGGVFMMKVVKEVIVSSSYF